MGQVLQQSSVSLEVPMWERGHLRTPLLRARRHRPLAQRVCALLPRPRPIRPSSASPLESSTVLPLPATMSSSALCGSLLPCMVPLRVPAAGPVAVAGPMVVAGGPAPWPPRGFGRAGQAIEPGSRLLVCYNEDPGFLHERVALWPASDTVWVYGVPGPERLYAQPDADFCFKAEVTAIGGMPADVKRYEVVSFASPLTNDELDDLIREGRREAERERARLQLAAPSRLPAASYDWQGTIRGLPGGWLPRFRFNAKRIHPAAWAPAALPAGLPVVVLPVDDDVAAADLPPLASPGTAPSTPMDVDAGLDAGDDCVWVISEVGVPSHPFGTTFEKLPAGSRRTSSRALFRVGVDDFITAELVRESLVPTWSDGFRSRVGQLVTTPRGEKPLDRALTNHGSVDEEVDDGPGDGGGQYQEARTLAVEYDEQGKRHKEWRSVVGESTHEYYPDFPVTGPCSAIDVCKHFLRHGGTPKMWLQQWCQDKNISQRDRVYHEISALIEIVYQAGCYDALNLGALASIEVAMRRLISIIEAQANNPQSPDWGNARYFSGTSNPFDIVPKDLRQHIAREAKDDVEVFQLRQKAQAGAYAADASWSATASAAAAVGGLPGDPAAVKDKKKFEKGKGKGKKPDKPSAPPGATPV